MNYNIITTEILHLSNDEITSKNKMVGENVFVVCVRKKLLLGKKLLKHCRILFVVTHLPNKSQNYPINMHLFSF